MGSELKVNTIDDYSGNVVNVKAATGLTVDNNLTVSGNITNVVGSTTLAGALTVGGEVQVGGGAGDTGVTVTTAGNITADGTLTAAGTITGTDVDFNGTSDIAKLEVGDPAGTAASGEAYIKEKLYVENAADAATAVVVTRGTVDCENSTVKVDQLEVATGGNISIGGDTYDSDDFEMFGASSQLKGFCVINFDMNATAPFTKVSGQITGTGATVGGGGTTLTIDHATLSGNQCVLMHSTIAGAVTLEHFYVSATAAGTTTFTLRNGGGDEVGKLHVVLLD